jgi:hypothetical protein
MIQAGALPLVCISKNAPTHWVFDTCVSMKSEGLTDHEGPPKEIETVTCVLQAGAGTRVQVGFIIMG